MQDLEKKYRSLKEKLLKISYICIGTINTVYTKCGNDYCECSKDDSKKHGPYYLWTSKKSGKTISKRLSKKQATLCQKFIKNHKRLTTIIEKMRQISMDIVENG
jgi:hypothetical protein